MSNNVLDFNKIKKNYLTIVLPDEKKTRLQVMTPTKRLLTQLMETLPEMSGDMPTEENLNTLYDFCARLMSRNKSATVITGEDLAACLDFEDLVAFFETYATFVSEIANSKN